MTSFLLAESPHAAYALPSGATHQADENGLIYLTGDAVPDRIPLLAMGCAILLPAAAFSADPADQSLT
jgi:hypothetical protein